MVLCPIRVISSRVLAPVLDARVFPVCRRSWKCTFPETQAFVRAAVQSSRKLLRRSRPQQAAAGTPEEVAVLPGPGEVLQAVSQLGNEFGRETEAGVVAPRRYRSLRRGARAPTCPN